MEKEINSAEVTFKFYLPEHKNEVFILTNAEEMYNYLQDIYNECRNVIKFGTNAEVKKFAELIRDLIRIELWR